MADVNLISRLGLVNAYLVRETNGLTVIDTMIGGSADKIVVGAEASGAPIVRILLTHAHADHIGSLEVIATPGHTPGHVALLDPRDGTLYCGDVYSTVGGIATSAKLHPIFPLALFTYHRPTELESARALRALEPARLAPGHGKVVESPLEAMDQAISRGY